MYQTCSKLTSFNFGDFTHCSDVSMVDFEQVNTGWVAESFYVYLSSLLSFTFVVILQ